MQLFSAIFNKQALMGCIFYKRVNMMEKMKEIEEEKGEKTKIKKVEKKKKHCC